MGMEVIHITHVVFQQQFFVFFCLVSQCIKWCFLGC